MTAVFLQIHTNTNTNLVGIPTWIASEPLLHNLHNIFNSCGRSTCWPHIAWVWSELNVLCVLCKVCSSKQKTESKSYIFYVLEDHKMFHQFMLFFSRLWHTVWLVGNIVVEVYVCVYVCASFTFSVLQHLLWNLVTH